MNTRVLIVRTVSIEEMSVVAAACRAEWPDARLCVLTSPNRRAELLDLGCLDEVIDYEIPVVSAFRWTLAPGGFGAPWTDGQEYAALVVPVRNGSGWGYGNVWHAVSRVSASAHWIAQWGATLRRVSVRRMLVRAWFEHTVQCLCAWPARALAALFLTHAGQREEFPNVRLPPSRWALRRTSKRDATGMEPEVRLKPDTTGVIP